MYGSFIFSQIFKEAKQEQSSEFWQDLNKNWIVYGLATIILCICGYFFLYDRRRRADVVRRRHMMQRAQERPPQKRRPGAAYRDHQIYRHIIKTVSKYMKNPPQARPNVEQFTELRRIRTEQLHGRETMRTTTAADELHSQ